MNESADVSKDETDLIMNKKNLIAPITLMATLLVLSTMSNVQALYTQGASDGTFRMSEPVEYYLRGAFNDGSNDASYHFVDCTLSMEPEEHKIKEYKLENKPFAKDVQLRVYANNGVYFKNGVSNCSYVHRWNNDEAFTDNEDKYYVVPMTSNTYTFYLKFYDDGSSQVYITANKDTLFFIPSNHWKEAGALFHVLQFNGQGEWAQDITENVEDPVGTFKFDVGTTYPKYKFARKNPDPYNPETWNASSLLTIVNDDTNNCFALWDKYLDSDVYVNSDWNADGFCGSWSTK